MDGRGLGSVNSHIPDALMATCRTDAGRGPDTPGAGYARAGYARGHRPAGCARDTSGEQPVYKAPQPVSLVTLSAHYATVLHLTGHLGGYCE